MAKLHEYQQKAVPNEHHSLNESINRNTVMGINPMIFQFHTCCNESKYSTFSHVQSVHVYSGVNCQVAVALRLWYSKPYLRSLQATSIYSQPVIEHVVLVIKYEWDFQSKFLEGPNHHCSLDPPSSAKCSQMAGNFKAHILRMSAFPLFGVVVSQKRA